MTAHNKGALFAIVGVLVLSPDALILKLISAQDSALVAIRAAFMASSMLVVVLLIPSLRRGFRWQPILLYSLFFSLGLVCFPLSIKHTHVANTLVIIAATPILAAIGAHLFLREKTSPHTWLAAAVIGIGMALIFSGEQADGLWLGNALALAVSVSLAAASLVVRHHQNISIYPGAVIGALLVAVVMSGFADWGSVGGRDWILLAIDGGVVMGASFLFIIAASRLLPPAEVNLFFLLETLFGPFWVWWVLHEIPPWQTVWAGALIVGVLMLHAMWTLFQVRRHGRRGRRD